MRRGHFDDDIHLVENVLPVSDETRTFSKITGHTHDGHVTWFLGAPAFHNFQGRQLVQHSLAPSADLLVQLSDRHDLTVQRGDLADHVHAAFVLGFFRYRNQVGRIGFGSQGWWLAVDTFSLVEVRVLVVAAIYKTPVEPFGSDPQPADVHPFQGPDHFLVRFSLTYQAALFVLEHIEVGCLDTSDGVTRGGLKQDGFVTIEGLFLKAWHNRPASDRFMRE